MTLLYTFLLATQLLAPATAKFFSGFSYGAFWTDSANCKRKADFLDSFKIAKGLATPVPFDSARLFTAIQCGTKGDPTEAFDAAVELNMNVLLGFWLSELIDPAKRTITNKQMLQNELAALEKGFAKHGKNLADLVIGLSVGNEDVHFFETKGAAGVPAEVIQGNMNAVREAVDDADTYPNLAKFWKGKPIGHTDTATYAANVGGGDFVGMNAYPYWNKDSPDNAKASFEGSIKDTRNRTEGKTDIWLTETGWPFEDNVSNVAFQNTASVANMQRYWNEVGCSVIGKYNTFWFQLIKDTEVQQPEWAIFDSTTRKPRIDLSCQGFLDPDNSTQPAPPSSQALVPSPSASPQPSTSTAISTSSPPPQTSSPPPASPPAAPSSQSPNPAPQVPSPNTSAQSSSPPAVPTPPPAAPIILPPPSSSASSVLSTSDAQVIVITTTVVVTVAAAAPTAAADATAQVAESPDASTAGESSGAQATGCITVANVSGTYISIASNPPGAGGVCATPPPYPGPAYVKKDLQPLASDAVSSLTMLAAPTATTASAQPTQPSSTTSAATSVQSAQPPTTTSISVAASASPKPSSSARKRRVRRHGH